METFSPLLTFAMGDSGEEKLKDASRVMAARHRDTRPGELSECRHHYTDGGISNGTRKNDICCVNPFSLLLQ